MGFFTLFIMTGGRGRMTREKAEWQRKGE